MAYRRRTASRTRRASSSTRRGSYSRSRTRAPARRRSRRVSSSPRTVRIVVQTVGASPVTPQATVQPMRAMF